MRIDVVRLENFRCFKRYELRLAKRFNLLIGDNGSGKTAILDALAVAAGSFLLGIPVDEVHPGNIEEEDLRRIDFLVGQTVTKEATGDAKIEAEWDATSGVSPVNELQLAPYICKWIRTRGLGSKTRTTRQLASAIQRYASNQAKNASDPTQSAQTTLPLLGYYGTGRLWHVLKDAKKEAWGPGSRFRGYIECLNPASDQKTLFRWFKSNELAALQKGERRGVLEAVRAAVTAMIPGAERLWWDFDWEELRLSVKIGEMSQTIPFHLLSDGYRNMLGMVADIAFRAAVLNPQFEEKAVQRTQGIVLVDELDLHLHPKWQRQVIPLLMDTFPNIQFVATSHSPFIIQSLYGTTDTLLWDLSTSVRLPVESKSIEDIAEDKQGVELPQQYRRYLDMEQAAERYYALLKKSPGAATPEKEQLRRELDRLSRPFSDDPAFQALLKLERLSSGVDSPAKIS